jgi:lipopolysaccharide/colanic/teichoic acid biosynthesis glycosyltransferase/glycosyltransferase involved in cell wall biosynthesis
MRILFFTQYYPPETGAAPLRAYHFATYLARAGHSVTVVTGMPNHPTGRKLPEYRRRLGARERRDGVGIIRCFLFASPEKTFATRMLNQISFAVSAIFGGLRAPHCDVVLVSSPPLFLGLAAWVVGVARGAPYVLDVRDYWPHAAVALGQLRSRTAIRLAAWLERFLYRRAARIIAVTPGMRRLMLERGIPRSRLELIPNGADTERFSPDPEARSAAANGGRTVLYSGTHGLVHGMEVILDAAELVRDDPSITFVLVGDGVAKDELVERAGRRSLNNVKFLPSQQPDRLVGTIRAADVCVATTRPGDFCESTVPVKVFDYMACGKPVAAAVSGDARAIIEQSGAGIVVPPGDGAALADALRRLLADEPARRKLGERGRAFVAREFSRTALAARMEDVLAAVDAEEALGGRPIRVRHYLGAKYALDAVGSLALLVLLAPVIGVLSLLIKLDSPGCAIFRQRRIGVYSEEFEICKFRTMSVQAPDIATDLMAHEPRDYTTRIGRFLRRTSLDELPNLWNVLRGHMSLVGPRPLLYNQYELIEARRRLGADIVRPGLTGWAQINGRDSITPGEKVRLDEFYVRNCSFRLDLRILLRTFAVMHEEPPGPARGPGGRER